MNEKNPWQTLSSRLVYSNPWISVREDQVIRPDGQPGIYGVVSTRIATGVVAVTPDRQVYLVGQYRYPTEHYSWEIIEGGTDDGEAPLQAAIREMREEAGLIADQIVQLGEEFHLSNCFSSEIGYVFLATGLRQVPSAPDGTEQLVTRQLAFDAALEMVHSGEIKDAVTIVGLYRAAKYLGIRV
ncbi:MAG: NUDIX hydrolase [Oligoflexia bacterium]|nr:NUDIX hydrolase [Oligoflexia bacterium]